MRLDALQLGIVCPMANEEATAVAFVDEVLRECARQGFVGATFFAVVDLVSRDRTRALLDDHARRRPGVRVVWAPETRGVADAYVRGYREALDSGCDWILEIDAGFSHDPREIGKLVAAMAAGNDCVFGTRFATGGSNAATFRRRVISRGGTALTNVLLGTRLTDMTGGFELFTRDALEHAIAKGIRSKGPFFQTEIRTHCRNLRHVEVPIAYDAASHRVGSRAVGEALANLARLFCLRLAGQL
jgi:dolichol-phosphate mannosyltransferase